MPTVPPAQLSHALREETSPDLRRRWVIGLARLGAAMGQGVARYQTGIMLLSIVSLALAVPEAVRAGQRLLDTAPTGA